MSKRRKGAARRSPAAHPPSYPAFDAVAAELPFVLATLRACGVSSQDRRDVAQVVLTGAWEAIGAGRYRPDPADDPRQAIKKFVHGIAWRQASHHRQRAWVRREIPHPEPRALLRHVVGPDPNAQHEARDILEVITELAPWQQEILVAVDSPESLVQYAKRRGMNPHSAASRLRLAREALALKLRRWRR